MPARPAAPALPPGVQLLQRGWLSSNNVLLGDADGAATLVDTGHCVHAAQTVALIERALAGRPLARIVNTHLHSDHCGGNAALRARFPDAALLIPPALAPAVAAWDEARLGFAALGQRAQRFQASGVLAPGARLAAGRRHWEVLAAPGHDPHSVMLFDAHDGTLISADALWENGFGVVFPELDGQPAFDEVGAVLDLIARLDVRRVLPGHGAPFQDVPAALQRARQRLQHFRREPARHARYAGKALLTYHVLEAGHAGREALLAWLAGTPVMQAVHARSGHAGRWQDWYGDVLDELLRQGVLARRPDGGIGPGAPHAG